MAMTTSTTTVDPSGSTTIDTFTDTDEDTDFDTTVGDTTGMTDSTTDEDNTTNWWTDTEIPTPYSCPPPPRQTILV